jgi:serine/threonine protein kinase
LPGDPISGSPQSVPEAVTVTIRVTNYVGQVLCGRYRVTQEIGSGGFGTVYLAHDEKLVSKPVVVKVLNHLTADTWVVRKFHQEIEALARIDHPGVVAVLDEGQTPEGAPFLVMQYVDGVTLRRLIQPGGMDLHCAAAILRQVGSALSAAHDKGVFHRDLKPENIMVQMPETDPHVRLIDFGIAGIKDSLYSQTEQSTRIAGTYRYMPPEQLEGNVRLESDIYAFGAIAFEMLTGQPPIKSPLELIALKIEGLKSKPRDLRRELPAATQDVILKALSFEPADRYSNAHEMGDLLADSLESAAAWPAAANIAPSDPEATRPSVPSADRLEIAHVLFLDLVGFSTLAMEDQRALLGTLQTLVRAAPHFAQAEKAGELISLPTGDGMALVFFGNPMASAECALDIARAARSNPAIRLRTGLHSGPVYRVADINKNRNVTGGAINMAQRVMDAGDAGHILVSAALAETLSQFSGWKQRLTDMGEHAVKHGALMRFYNLCAEDAGNPAVPSKWEQAPTPPRRSRGTLIMGAIAVALAAGVGIYVALRPGEAPPVIPAKNVPSPLALELEYSVNVKRPDGRITRYSSERIVPAGYEVQVQVQPPKPGFLYVVNDGPLDAHTQVIVVLYPGTDTPAAIEGGKTFQAPWALLDQANGGENLYLIWSAAPVPEMEALKDRKDLLFNNHVTLRDDLRSSTLQFLSNNEIAESDIRKDHEAGKTRISTQRAILVHHIRLEHD